MIVTGGSRGLGAGIVQAYLDAGERVAACARSRTSQVDRWADDPALADRFHFAEVDLSDRARSAAFVKQVVERWGTIDVLVNNAGGAPPSETATVSPKFSTAIITLNLIAPLLFAQQANAVMQRQDDGGVIVNIASVSGMRPSPNTAAYGAAKAGLINLTETLAVELAPKVRVVTVTAGLVITEQAHLFYGDEEGIAAVGRTVPLGRMADPSDIADVCLFVASPLARYVTGANIVVHGGGEKPAYMDAATTT